ncbi:hypothetical protein Terro_4396 [Terriglobus roseus DSM 18391]|uniref:Uncharacterized protein n=1 Tax=Terriglobus roseus (strain DSM 18391 / NRRL B-41598 / KBS 63) TaxID=926566 RepID=I3ZMX4_TERRK|nr:hypothetical protein [Terriglobus roseus]AFL90592.1 hypothetical protein Terro_4396 [Terriglobus roseus DSM 18391]
MKQSNSPLKQWSKPTMQVASAADAAAQFVAGAFDGTYLSPDTQQNPLQS